MREGFYPTINSVIDPNLFEDIRLRTVVGMIKDYYEQYGAVPSFRTAEMLIQSSNTLDPITKEEVVAALNRCKEETSEAESEVVKRARYFFSRQKALILFNEGQRKLIGNNSLEALSSTFSKLQQVMDAAHGSEPVQKSQYNVEELFSPHSRGPVPTGVKKLDEILEGGLGKGEIGLIIGGSGFGKVQPNDSNVATPYGFMKMGELELGDTILGKNGKPIKVVGIFPHNEWEFYRVTFNDDTYTECGLEHLWNVNTLEREKNGEPYITCSLREIMNTGQVDKFFIPVCDCIEYPERDLQMDPYDMGLMLGIAAEHRKRNIDYNNINLDDYYYNTKENRVKFLNGILDVIGYLNANTGLPYIPVVYRDEIYPIVRKVVESLGCLVSFPEDDDTEMRLVLFEGCDFKPFYAEEWLNDHIKYKKKEEYHRFITEVEYSRTTDGRCIKVDAEDELYLTDDYIVTHNTTTLTVASLAGNFKKVLIICPASLKSTWRDELMNYIDESEITIVNGKTWKESKYTILNYDILKNFYEIPMVYDEEKKKYVKSRRKADIQKSLENSQLFQSKFDLVIIDECHKLSRNTSTRYKIIDDFLKKSKPNSIYLTSGTPITNNTKNLYNILKLINSDVVKDYEYYMRRYCGAKKIHNKKLNRDILIPTGNTNLEELMERIKGHYIRRTLKDVNLDIPFTTDVLKYDFDEPQQNMYDKLWNQYLESQEKEGMEAYKPIIEGTLLRKWAAVEMLPKTYDIVDDHIEYGGKAVIMCTFDDEIEELSKHYGNKCVVYNGKMNLKQKDKAKDEFINDPNKQVFIGNLIAAGVGLTLIVADLIVFNSFSWVPGENEQAERRIIRIGQDKSCRIVYQVFNNSIFEKMYNVVSKKQDDINTVIKTESEKI